MFLKGKEFKLADYGYETENDLPRDFRKIYQLYHEYLDEDELSDALVHTKIVIDNHPIVKQHELDFDSTAMITLACIFGSIIFPLALFVTIPIILLMVWNRDRYKRANQRLVPASEVMEKYHNLCLDRKEGIRRSS
ncbi:hypothetical protein SKM54_06860 [Acinetobacter faecalis]|uniref:hypothetical protein n=1 Tax=Acinetobacter faecalis TaxID=2665161 RepID=UPI002A90F0EB|nr:hypothetical protein [Acinetobacter faecalis]MDY6482161.1 hypothetical protein [Acinetobacter faecalis]